MNILVTGANGQLGNEMRIISKGSDDNYIFTDVNQVEGLPTTYLDITDLDAIRKMVAENNVQAIVNCAAWTNVDGAEEPEKYALVEQLNATAPENLAKAMKEVTGQDNEFMTILSEKFGRTYPYQYLSNLFVKTTVSELKKRAMHGLPEQSTVENEAFTRALFEEPEVVPYIPSFISSKEGMSGTDRGSAYHKVMELLDFAAIRESITENDMEKEINGQLDSFVMEGRLSSQWRESVSVSKIVRFLESDLAKRMAQSASKGLLRREQPFVLGLRASRLGGEFPDSEQVLIQGIIDVFFEEEGKIVVADYKTDAVKTSEELVKRYQVQLDYYSEALMRLTGKEVTEKIIYSFALGREIMLY